MHAIVSAKIVNPYRLELTFETQEQFVYDAEPDLWGEVFEPLRDPDYFARVQVDDFGGLSWPNGADYCADFLYLKMEEARKLQPSGR